LRIREKDFSIFSYTEFWEHEKKDLLLNMLHNLYDLIKENREFVMEMVDGEIYIHNRLPLLILDLSFPGEGVMQFLDEVHDMLPPYMEDISLYIVQFGKRTFVFINYFSEEDAWSDCTWDCNESCSEWAAEVAGENEEEYERVYRGCMEDCYECPEREEAFTTILMEISAAGAAVKTIYEDWGISRKCYNIEDINWKAIMRVLEILKIEVEVEL